MCQLPPAEVLLRRHPGGTAMPVIHLKLKRRPGRLSPLEESPGTPRNRTGEFPLHLVRGGPSVVRSSWVEAGWHATLFPLGDSNLSTAPSLKEASRIATPWSPNYRADSKAFQATSVAH